eukprot:TRINITY_DN11316_c0_g1_i1.p1 TRINITY_DN11316_c0_g1~~TRINITY_DN11316_c0_g1_i1.p1  ORF type:complete len:345 (-),score=90.16 TRINITY_DN11316_c0_g1_i1:26-1027(-)
MAVPHWLGRTNILLGEEKVTKLLNANVLVVGLGGVGGICAEMIARAGVGKMTIVDADTVDPTNRNRQIPALSSTEGKPKASVLAERIKDVNPDLDLTVLEEYISDGRAWEILEAQKYDYAVDCIDTLSCKAWFIRACWEKKIPFVASMGAGGKVDPTLVKVIDISQTKHCHLAHSLKRRLKKWGIDKGFPVVWSSEKPDMSRVISTPNDPKKKSVIGTISYMPAVFGCTVASVVIRGLYEGGITSFMPPEEAPPSKRSIKRKVNKAKKKAKVRAENAKVRSERKASENNNNENNISTENATTTSEGTTTTDNTTTATQTTTTTTTTTTTEDSK